MQKTQLLLGGLGHNTIKTQRCYVGMKFVAVSGLAASSIVISWFHNILTLYFLGWCEWHFPLPWCFHLYCNSSSNSWCKNHVPWLWWWWDLLTYQHTYQAYKMLSHLRTFTLNVWSNYPKYGIFLLKRIQLLMINLWSTVFLKIATCTSNIFPNCIIIIFLPFPIKPRILSSE